MLFAYVARVRGDDALVDRAVGLLNSRIARISAYSSARRISLYGGLCGLGWTVNHLTEFLYHDGDYSNDEDASDLLGDVDAAVLRELHKGWDDRPFDLIEELVGIGVYLLSRLPRQAARDLLVRILDYFENTADEHPDGVTWRSGPH
jgi:hypothetical protein